MDSKKFFSFLLFICIINLSKSIRLKRTISSDEYFNSDIQKIFFKDKSVDNNLTKKLSNIVNESSEKSETNIPFEWTHNLNRTRKSRFLIKKILNIIEGCNDRDCSKNCNSNKCCLNPLNSLFGFAIGNSNCCAYQFVDDGLEPDYRNQKYRNQKIKYEQLNNGQSLYGESKKDKEEINETFKNQIKSKEKVVEKTFIQRGPVKAMHLDQTNKASNSKPYFLIDKNQKYRQKFGLFSFNDVGPNVYLIHYKPTNDFPFHQKFYDSLISKRPSSMTHLIYSNKFFI